MCKNFFSISTLRQKYQFKDTANKNENVYTGRLLAQSTEFKFVVAYVCRMAYTRLYVWLPRERRVVLPVSKVGVA